MTRIGQLSSALDVREISLKWSGAGHVGVTPALTSGSADCDTTRIETRSKCRRAVCNEGKYQPETDL